VVRGRIERFFKSITSVLGHCILEEWELLPEVTVVLVGLGFVCAFWVIGVVVYDFTFDPHFTKDSLDAVSINPDKWFLL